jgi:hypothetical protein
MGTCAAERWVGLHFDRSKTHLRVFCLTIIHLCANMCKFTWMCMRLHPHVERMRIYFFACVLCLSVCVLYFHIVFNSGRLFVFYVCTCICVLARAFMCVCVCVCVCMCFRVNV